MITPLPNPYDPKEQAQKALDSTIAPLRNSMKATVAGAYKDIYLSPIAQFERIMQPHIEARNKRIAELAKVYDAQTSIAALAAKWQEMQPVKITGAIGGVGIDPTRLGGLTSPQIAFDPKYGVQAALTVNMMEKSIASKALGAMNSAPTYVVSGVGFDVKSLMGNALGNAPASAIAAGLNEQMLGFKPKGLASAAVKANELTAKLPEECIAQLGAIRPEVSGLIAQVAKQYQTPNLHNVFQQWQAIKKQYDLDVSVETDDDIDGLIEDCPDVVQEIQRKIAPGGKPRPAIFVPLLGIPAATFKKLTRDEYIEFMANALNMVYTSLAAMLKDDPIAAEVLFVILIGFMALYPSASRIDRGGEE